MSDLVFEVAVDVPEVDVAVVEPVVAALTVLGPAGPKGDPGDSFSGFLHTQSSPAATWSVTHTLGRIPYGSELLVSGQVVFADIEYPDVFTAVVTFAEPQQGSLRLT